MILQVLLKYLFENKKEKLGAAEGSFFLCFAFIPYGSSLPSTTNQHKSPPAPAGPSKTAPWVILWATYCVSQCGFEEKSLIPSSVACMLFFVLKGNYETAVIWLDLHWRQYLPTCICSVERRDKMCPQDSLYGCLFCGRMIFLRIIPRE